MFEPDVVPDSVLDGRLVETWVSQLARFAGPLDDRGRVDLLGALERLTCAAAGLQADVAAELDDSMRAANEKRRGAQGAGPEVALACRESPHRGRRRVSLGLILRDEMPFTRRALRDGQITSWKATILARETGCLSLADRQTVDRRLAGDPRRVEAMGDGELEGAARSLAEELDPAACVLRRRIAESERHVTLRPAPDTMSRLCAELPVASGVAVLKSLADAADVARAGGDARSRGQVMTDTLVERVLGTCGGVVPVEVELVVSDEVLFGTRDDAAYLEGYGPIPAELARELAKSAGEAGLARLRRLYRSPDAGQLVAMDSRSRCFDGGLAHFVRLRDRICRTPWCGAPIRHTDHAKPVAGDGQTSSRNGQGLCEACNYAKEAVGWSVTIVGDSPHAIEIRTPTGQVHRSQAPPLPGHVPRPGGPWGIVPRIDLAFSYPAA